MNEKIQNLPEELQQPIIEQLKEISVFHRYCTDVRDSLKMLENQYPDYRDRLDFCGGYMQKVIINLRGLHEDLLNLETNLSGDSSSN